jgi:hypothetical protein
VNNIANESAVTCMVPTCIATPEIAEPIPLCFAHALEVVSHAMPQVIRTAASALPQAPSGVRMLTVSCKKLLAANSHDPAVYFIQNGGRVKIGTTQNLRRRTSALSLRPENVLLTVYGGADVERELHARFRDLRVGNTEWFRYGAPLVEFIRVRSEGLGSPTTPSPGMPDGIDPRRDLVFSVVAQAGSEDIGPEAVIRKITQYHPDVDPPHAATIGRWLSTDPRVSKPGYGRYAVSSI